MGDKDNAEWERLGNEGNEVKGMRERGELGDGARSGLRSLSARFFPTREVKEPKFLQIRTLAELKLTKVL